MGITDTVFGSPGQTQVHQTAGSKPPGFNFARDFFNSLSGIAQNPYPTYQGQIDPGLSPTLQGLMRQAQGYSQSAPPEILAGVQGSLGRFMNPNFMNPVARMQQGVAPDYFNQNPNQTVWNGGSVGGLAGVFSPNSQGSSAVDASKSGVQTFDPMTHQPTGNQVGMQGGYQLPNGQMNQTPPFYGGSPGYGQAVDSMGGYGSSDQGSAPNTQMPPNFGQPVSSWMTSANGFGSSPGSGNNFSMGGPLADFPMSEMPGSVSGGIPHLPGPPAPIGQFPLNTPWPTGGTPPTGNIDWNNIMGGENAANNAHPGMPGPAGQGGGRTFGGYTAQQLQSDPSLAGRLGQHAAGLWRAFNPGGAGGPNTRHPVNPGQPMGMKPNRNPNRGGVAELPGAQPMGLK